MIMCGQSGSGYVGLIGCSVSGFVRCMSVYHPILQFFRALIHPEYSAVTDVYVLMFLADTVDFIIIVFGFWAFGVKFDSHHIRPHLLKHLCLNGVSLILFKSDFVFPETLCSCWHHFLPFRRSSSWSILGDGSDPVWYVSLAIHLFSCVYF